jgi:hypothetical protein
MEEELAKRMISDPAGTVEIVMPIILDGVKKNIRNPPALFQIMGMLQEASIDCMKMVEDFYEPLAEKAEEMGLDKKKGHEDFTE